MSVDEALVRMLVGTDYFARRVGANAWRIEKVPQRRTLAASQSRSAPLAIGKEIIVTGTKRSVSLDSAPIAVAVARPDAVAQMQPASDSASVASQVEGLALTGQGPGRNRMFLRGVADSAFGGKTQSTVAVLLDDARLTYSAPDPDIRLVDVERVELLKGPQGSLYGTGAIGGIYRVVTHRADLSNVDISGSATGEVVEHGAFGGSAALVANLPLVQDRVGLRLVGYTEKTAGWVDTGSRSNSNGSDVLGLRVGLGVDVGSGWRADLTGFGQWLNLKDSGYVYSPYARLRPAQLPEPHDNDLLHGSLRMERDRGPVRFVLSSGYTRHDVDDTFDATRGADTFGLADPAQLLDRNEYTVWDNEIRADGHWGAIGWLGGVSYLSSTQDSERDLLGFSGTSLNVDSDQRATEELALFGEVTVPLTSSLESTVGARGFRSLIEESRTEGPDSVERRFIRYGLTPSVGLAWHPRAGNLVYLHYGSAFRQGGTGIGSSEAIEALDGDELATISAGWRDTEGMLRFDLGLYHSWWSSIQSDVLRPNGLIETANVGNGAITGAELSLEVEPAENWHLQAGAMVQSALIDAADAPPGADDRRLPVVPDMTFRAAVVRDFFLGDWDVSAKLQMNYIGSARLSFDPDLDRKMGKVLGADAHIRASRGSLIVALEVLNLFDGRHDTFAYGNPLRIRQMQQYTPQEPRTARLTLVFRR